MKEREHWMDEYEFTFLYALRDSGITNMLGARPYLEDYCGCAENLSKQVLSQWKHECRNGGTVLQDEEQQQNYRFALEHIENVYKQH
mgnify:CR=1 FL=1